MKTFPHVPSLDALHRRKVVRGTVGFSLDDYTDMETWAEFEGIDYSDLGPLAEGVGYYLMRGERVPREEFKGVYYD